MTRDTDGLIIDATRTEAIDALQAHADVLSSMALLLDAYVEQHPGDDSRIWRGLAVVLHQEVDRADDIDTMIDISTIDASDATSEGAEAER